MLLARTNTFDGLDRAFQQLTSGLFPSGGPAWRSGPTIQGAWHDDDLELTVDLPGVPRDAISIEVSERTLTIGVDHASDDEHMRWARALQLGDSLDTEKIHAEYRDGRLTISVPAVEQAPARRIELSDTSSPSSIEVGQGHGDQGTLESGSS